MALVFIFVTVVLDMLALGMILPVLPHLIEDFLGGDTARAAEIFGVFGSVFGHNVTQNLPVLGIQSVQPAQNYLSVFSLTQPNC